MYPFILAIWRLIWIHTVENSQTNAISVTLHPQRQAIWGNIWKHTLKVEQIKPDHETRVTLVSECDISVSKTSRFRNYSNCWDGIGIGCENFWFQKKYRYRFRKKLVSKKVSVSVSKNFGIKKSIGIGFENLCIEKDTNIHDLFHHLEPWTIWAKENGFN